MKDVRGNLVGTCSAAALEATERALWSMLSFYGSPFDALDDAHAADPDWMLPLLMQAGFLLSLTEPALLPQARALLERAAPMLARATPRERDHLGALHDLIAGDWAAACGAWEALLLREPRDLLALHWAHLFDFYRGDAVNLRQRVARVLPEWAEDDPFYPYVLGDYAFGLEECHLYAQAEEVGRRALSGSAKVPWAIHAVAHVMEMQGRWREGSDWMVAWQADWSQGNGFSPHLGWHQGLFALEALDHAQALRLFDAHLRADPAQMTLQRLDAVALLWRLHLQGVDTGGRWNAISAAWHDSDRATSPVAGLYPFNDLHGLLALIGSGQLGRARAWVEHAATQAARFGGGNARVARDLGVPLMRGMLSFGGGRYDEAIDALYPLRMMASHLGGSHAQRDLLDQTLLAAAAQARDGAVGRALLNERRLAKPATPLTDDWARRLKTRHPRHGANGSPP
ncbi:MAG: tetratricopeptide repeat protein [Pseudomonadota bacterium]|nr:tetratricopeptide repeat protein [Pseudomonadota bacterium]